MTKQPTVEDVLAHMRSAIPYSSENYPKLATLQGPDEVAFVFGHALLHQQKAVGAVAAMLEAYEHGHKKALKTALLKRAVIKMFGNAARLLSRLGISPAEVMRTLEKEFPVPPQGKPNEPSEEELVRRFREVFPRHSCR